MPHKDFKVRPARPQDVETIVRLQRAAVEKSWRPAVGSGFDAFLAERFNHESQVEKYTQRLADPGRFILVVESENTIAGFGGARKCGPEEQPPGFGWQASAFYIAPEWEGKGAGRVLFSALLGELAARGATDMSLWCLAGNDPARGFYEKNGGALLKDVATPEEYNAVAPHVAYGWKL